MSAAVALRVVELDAGAVGLGDVHRDVGASAAAARSRRRAAGPGRCPCWPRGRAAARPGRAARRAPRGPARRPPSPSRGRAPAAAGWRTRRRRAGPRRRPADRTGQPLGGDPQQPVADRVAEGVVDLLEPVQVEQEQRAGDLAWCALAIAARVCSTRCLRLARPVRSSFCESLLALPRGTLSLNWTRQEGDDGQQLPAGTGHHQMTSGASAVRRTPRPSGSRARRRSRATRVPSAQGDGDADQRQVGDEAGDRDEEDDQQPVRRYRHGRLSWRGPQAEAPQPTGGHDEADEYCEMLKTPCARPARRWISPSQSGDGVQQHRRQRAEVEQDGRTKVADQATPSGSAAEVRIGHTSPAMTSTQASASACADRLGCRPSCPGATPMKPQSEPGGG